MIRQTLLTTATLVVLTGCASTGSAVPAPSSASAGSTGITSQDAARIAPLAPPQLTAVTDAGSVRLTWPTTGEDVAYYRCLRRAAPDGQWQPAGHSRPDQRTCLDRNPRPGTYVYGVQAVNGAGLDSTITESQPVTIA